MVLTTATDDATARRRAWALAIFDALAIALASPLLVTAVSAPAIAVILSSVPQVAAFVPEPVREVTLVMDGLQGISGDLTQGADGKDGVELDEEAPLVVPPVPDLAPPAPEPAEPQDDAVADATPAEPRPKPKPPVDQVENPNLPTLPEPAPEPTVAPEPTTEPATPPDEPAAEPTPPAVDGATPDATGAAAPATPPRKPGRSAKCAETNPAIHKVASTTWTVERTLVDYYASSMDRFNSLGYSHKWTDDTGQKGWQIGGFGCSSPLWKAGLRSQDVIQLVNGKKTNNVLQLFGIWMSQRNKAKFEVQVLRKGKPMVLSYQIL